MATVSSLKQFVFCPKRKASGKEKDGNIQPIYRYAKNTGIGIIKYRNEG